MAAISTNKQSAFSNRICSALLHRISSSAGLQTSTAKHRAREIATFNRFLLNRNSRFLGISSPLEVAIEKQQTAASPTGQEPQLIGKRAQRNALEAFECNGCTGVVAA